MMDRTTYRPRREVKDFAPRVRMARLRGGRLALARSGVVVALLVLWQVF